MIDLVILPLAVASGVLWRMGGADGYNKLYRRLGCTICCLAYPAYAFGLVWPLAGLIGLVLWGSISYFGWINNLLPIKEKDSEYWWNFFAENLTLQSGALFYVCSVNHIIFAVIAALLSALGKVLIDADEDAKVLCWNEAVLSEWWHGFSNCLFLLINIFII